MSENKNNPHIILVADFFVEDISGGAELSTQALIDSCPEDLILQKMYSRDVNIENLEKLKDSFWIFTNIAGMDLNLIPSIAANLDYSIIEYDYKFCKYRSVEKHKIMAGEECDCHTQIHGKVISAFFLGAKSIWWMSEAQQSIYIEKFPFLENTTNIVLSSVFDDSFFIKIKELNMLNLEKSGWLILDSDSWIKGTEDAVKYCEDNNLKYSRIKGLPYNKVLEKLAQAEGLVYLPRGGDTCPRLVIEAHMLGCRLILNENVQHKDEIWFDTDNFFDIESYLYAARERFWNAIIGDINWEPKISGYTTVYNCIQNEYPWEKTIESMLGFCDEVVVVDSGSDDGTWEKLLEISKTEDRIVAKQNKIDWEHPRFAYHSDGMQKALARSFCTGDYCWQMDSDEFVLPKDFEKIKNLVKRFPKLSELVALPVVEFWGSFEKVRVDINPWKWRISKNKPYITHGIPKELQRFDDNGDMYTAPGSDTCDYIHKETSDRIPFIAYYSEEVEMIRRKALTHDKESLEKYEKWYGDVAESVPTVYHMSWFDIERKIKLYKTYWTNFWLSQYNVPLEDIPENNMFFNKPWKEVTDSEISDLANKLANDMGGWIFHSKINWSSATPSIKISHNCKEYLEDE